MEAKDQPQLRKKKLKAKPKSEPEQPVVEQIPQQLQPPEVKESHRQLIVVLEAAGLDYSRLHKKKPELLSYDENEKFIRERLKRDPEDYKPHIVHQCLLNLMDSPLNKAGLLKVLVNTFNGQLIEINPTTRIPRTYQRFSPLIGQLLKR